VRLAQATLDARQQTASITGRRKDAGAASGLDVSTADAAVQSARLALAEARTAQAQARHALRGLMGTDLAEADAPPPLADSQDLQRLLTADNTSADNTSVQSASTGTSTATAAYTAAGTDPWPVALQAVPAALPASTLLARADVRSAELNLYAARADVGAARAALWPRLSLTASTGLASAALGTLLSGGSFVWALAPTLSVPLFDGGATQANLDGAQVAQQIALTQYEQTVQTAFTEVADALAVRERLAERLDAQQQLVTAYGRSVSLSQTRLRLGAESPLTVLSAQATWLAGQQALINLHLAEQANRLTLYKVLGGA
jgi:outer membrane protein TolC